MLVSWTVGPLIEFYVEVKWGGLAFLGECDIMIGLNQKRYSL